LIERIHREIVYLNQVSGRVYSLALSSTSP
jgi:hypothetical protein